MLLKYEELAKQFNQYIGHITDSLVLLEFPSEKCEGLNDINDIVFKFKNHLSIIKIKKHFNFKSTFLFRLVTPVHKRDDPTDKVTGQYSTLIIKRI